MFDETKFYLGEICSVGHEYKASGKSLRYISSDGCVEHGKIASAKRTKLRQAKLQKTKNADKKLLKQDGIDTNKFRLGILCHGKHEYKNTGKTLRVIIPSKCLQCTNKYSLDRYRERTNYYGRKKANAQFKAKNRFLAESFGIDTTKWYFSKICSKGHEYKNTGRTLRTIDQSRCRDCEREDMRTRYRNRSNFWTNKKTQAKTKAKNRFLAESFGIDTTKWYLGKVCIHHPNEHTYKNTGITLRRVIGGGCIECQRLRSIKISLQNKEKRRKKREEEFQANIALTASFGLDTSRVVLNSLCCKSHDFKNTGRSLRRLNKNKIYGICLECEKEKRQTEEYKAKRREERQHTTQEKKEQQRIYARLYARKRMKDPEYRIKVNARKREINHIRYADPEYRAERNAERREDYKTNPRVKNYNKKYCKEIYNVIRCIKRQELSMSYIKDKVQRKFNITSDQIKQVLIDICRTQIISFRAQKQIKLIIESEAEKRIRIRKKEYQQRPEVKIRQREYFKKWTEERKQLREVTSNG